MIANAAWLTEFILETIAAFFFFRRRITVLWIWLGFAACADIIGFLLTVTVGFRAYSWADYISRQAQYALIALASVWTVSQVLREHPRTRRTYLWLLGAMAVASIALFHHGLPSAGAVLRFEIWAEITLAGFVAAAMGTANGPREPLPCVKPLYRFRGSDVVSHYVCEEPDQPNSSVPVLDSHNQMAASRKAAGAPKPWGLIACGLVVLGSSDLLVTALRLRGFRAEGIYPFGEILALGILCWAGWKDWQLEEVRVPLGTKKPPSSVGRPEILRMFG